MFSIAGRGGNANSGFVVLTLAPWSERQRSQNDIVSELNTMVSTVPGMRAFAIQRNSLGIRGAGNGLAICHCRQFLPENWAMRPSNSSGYLEEDDRFTQVRLSYETTQPQLSVSIDRARASDLGIDIDGLAQAMQAQLDGTRCRQCFHR